MVLIFFIIINKKMIKFIYASMIFVLGIIEIIGTREIDRLRLLSEKVIYLSVNL